MQDWFIYGLLASLFWGSYIVVTKVATSEKYFGMNASYVSLFMLIGIAVVFVANIFFTKTSFVMPKSAWGIGVSILAGILWGLGMFVSLKALSAGADVSKLTPLYNTNTLVALLLGVILLGELPAAKDLVKVIIGSILIVIGAILISF
jgi:uncharacterized membrane protein